MTQISDVKKIIKILRNSKIRQIRGDYYDEEGGMCAAGLIQHGFGMYDKFGHMKDVDAFDRYDEAMCNMFEQTKIDETQIVVWNDVDELTFKNIALTIEMSIKKKRKDAPKGG